MARKVQLEHMSEPHRIEEIAKDLKNMTEKEKQKAVTELKDVRVIYGAYLVVGGAGPHIMTFTFNGRELDMEDDRETAILVLEKERI